jgi:glycosyltransferase involved in cell wall biosynthesis
MPKEKIKILVLSSWYPYNNNPTFGNFNEKFAEASALYNDVSAIFVVGEENLNCNYKIDNFKKNNVNTYICYFKKPTNNNFFQNILKFYKYFKSYRKLYKIVVKENGKPNLIHLNILYPVGIIALIFKVFYRLNYVISENWTGYLPSNKVNQKILATFITKTILKKASVIMPVTFDLKKALENIVNNARYKIIPNVTDTKYFYPNNSKTIKDKKVILHVSSLKDEHKNISGILRTIKNLHLKRQDFILNIVGDGDLTSHIEYMKKLELTNNIVNFHGKMEVKEIAETMRNSDIFVLFSNYENLPCVIVEALASGLPVVSSTAGGISEHISPENGILLEPKDEKALFDALDYMLDNFNNYNKEMLHNYAIDNFSYENVGKKLTEIYSQII